MRRRVNPTMALLVRLCLTCDLKRNMLMSNGTVDQRREVGAPERSASVTRARNPGRRCGGIARRRMWNIAPARISLHRRSASFETAGSDSSCVDPNHVQDSRRHRGTAAGLLCEDRHYIERDCHTCNKGVPRICKQEWLSAANGSVLKSIVTTSLIVCSFTNCNKRMRFSSQITSASSSAIKRSQY